MLPPLGLHGFFQGDLYLDCFDPRSIRPDPEVYLQMLLPVPGGSPAFCLVSPNGTRLISTPTVVLSTRFSS